VRRQVCRGRLLFEGFDFVFDFFVRPVRCHA
jgi:hypothetical protein